MKTLDFIAAQQQHDASVQALIDTVTIGRDDLESIRFAQKALGDGLEALMQSRDLIRTTDLTDALVATRQIQILLGKLAGKQP